MKFTPLFVLFLIATLDCRADLEFRGVMKVGTDTKFNITDSNEEKLSGWFKVNERVGAYTIKEYVEKEELLVLVAGEKLIKIKLLDSKTNHVDVVVKVDKEIPKEILDTTVEGLAKRGLYRMERGDTGLKIALKHGVSIVELRTLNPDVNWSRLQVGQIVRFKKE